MYGIMGLIHGGCAVIMVSLAIGIYRQKPDIQSYEAFLARKPMFIQIVMAAGPALILAGSLELVSGKLASPVWFIDTVGLIVHEGGHFLTMWAGEFVHFLGGTLFEIGVPAALTIWALTLNCKRLGAFALAWTSVASFSASEYSGDANALELKLLGASDSIEDKMIGHDWHNILGMIGQLDAAPLVSDMFWSVAVVAGLSAIALPIWAIYRDHQSQAVFNQKLS
jgi:hypothetical protein